MRISQFDYELPGELIAQHSLGGRDASRMLVVNRAGGSWRDGACSEFPSELRAGDTLVLNNTRVFPARLVGRRETTGGRVELLLVRRREDVGVNVWEALARPARRLDAGARLEFGGGRLRAEVLSATEDGAARVVRFDADGDFDALVEEFGQMPLPPYIKREGDDLASSAQHRQRSQTVSAAPRSRRARDELSPAALVAARLSQRLRRSRPRARRVPPRSRRALPLLQLRRLHAYKVTSDK